MANKKTLIAFQITAASKTNQNGEPVNIRNRTGTAWVN
jgi:hypothetical protein